MIQSTILFAINHLLLQEPWCLQRLQAHAGKHIALESSWFNCLAQITEQGILRQASEQAAPSVSLKIASDLLTHVLQHGVPAAIQKIYITGDAELVSAIGDVLQHLRWDAEQDLSYVVGDVAARRLMQAARTCMEQARNSGQSIAENFAEYFTEENPLLITQTTSAQYRNQLQDLRDAIARLEKHIERLER